MSSIWTDYSSWPKLKLTHTLDLFKKKNHFKLINMCLIEYKSRSYVIIAFKSLTQIKPYVVIFSIKYYTMLYMYSIMMSDREMPISLNNFQAFSAEPSKKVGGYHLLHLLYVNLPRDRVRIVVIFNSGVWLNINWKFLLKM